MVEREEIKDPRVGMVTFTQVKVSRDLRHARVFYSLIGDKEEKARSREGLNSARSFFRKELGSRLGMKHTPTIDFEYDRTIEEGARISKLLHKLHEKERADD